MNVFQDDRSFFPTFQPFLIKNNWFSLIVVWKYYAPVLNLIRSPDCDPTGFCTSEPDPDWTGFWKNLPGSDMDIQTALITAVKCLISFFFGYKLDWIKYFDRSTGLGSHRITDREFWIGLGFQKSPICWTLLQRWALDRTWIGLDQDYDEFYWIWIGPGKFGTRKTEVLNSLIINTTAKANDTTDILQTFR